MKKLFILALSVMMILSLTACGKKKSEDIAITDDMSVVEKFDATFKNMADDEDVTAEMMLKKMKEFLPSEMMVDIVSVDEVYMGFDDEIKGFDKATLLAPTISSIAFICYIFEVSEDIEGFVKNVEEMANPSWNICVTADDKLVDQSNGFVLVVMAPTSFNSK